MKSVKFIIKNFQLFTEDKIFEFSDVPNIGEVINVKSYLSADLVDTFEYELSKTYYSEYGKIIEKYWDVEKGNSTPILTIELLPGKG